MYTKFFLYSLYTPLIAFFELRHVNNSSDSKLHLRVFSFRFWKYIWARREFPIFFSNNSIAMTDKSEEILKKFVSEMKIAWCERTKNMENG